MTASRGRVGIAIAFSCAALAASQALFARASGDRQRAGTSVRSRLTTSHSLPSMDGRQLKVSVVEVTYGPGGSSAPHSHPCPIVGYVIEGSLRMQVEGEPETVYKAGESFYEAPDGVHLVSANASDRESARFVAFFTCDRDAPLSAVVPEAQPVEKE